MAQYRKKPVVVEAEQFWPDVHPWPDGVLPKLKDSENQYWFIPTLEGPFNVNPGDWIITGIAGEKYPIKDEIFKETYDFVGD